MIKFRVFFGGSVMSLDLINTSGKSSIQASVR